MAMERQSVINCQSQQFNLRFTLYEIIFNFQSFANGVAARLCENYCMEFCWVGNHIVIVRTIYGLVRKPF